MVAAVEMKPHTMGFDALPGTSGRVELVLANSITESEKWLRRGRGIYSSGPGGAVMVWKNDSGLWCCEFHRFEEVLDHAEWTETAFALVWLLKWWPELKQ